MEIWRQSWLTSIWKGLVLVTYGSAGIFTNLTHVVVKFFIHGSTIDSYVAFKVSGYLTFHVEKVLAYQSLLRVVFPLFPIWLAIWGHCARLIWTSNNSEYQQKYRSESKSTSDHGALQNSLQHIKFWYWDELPLLWKLGIFFPGYESCHSHNSYDCKVTNCSY